MSQFNAEKHVEDIAKISEALLAILGKAGEIIDKGLSDVSKDYKETFDVAKEAKQMLFGKKSSMTTFTDYEVMDDGLKKYYEREGKFVLLPPKAESPNDLNLVFLEKKQTLEIPQYLKEYLSVDDVARLKDTGHLNRIIYVDQNGKAKPKYLSVDKDLNIISTMSIERFKLKDEVMGVKLSPEEKAAILDGKSVLLTGLINPKSPDKPFDAVVTIDASKRELSFQKPTGIPRLLAGKELSDEQMSRLEKGETVMLTDLYSKNKDKHYDAYVKLDKEKDSLEIVPYTAPKKILGVDLTQEQIFKLRIGEELHLQGMTSKKGEVFEANIQLSKDKGLVFKKPSKEITSNEVEQKTIINSLDKSYYQLSHRFRATPSIQLNTSSPVINGASLGQSEEKKEVIGKKMKF